MTTDAGKSRGYVGTWLGEEASAIDPSTVRIPRGHYRAVFSMLTKKTEDALHSTPFYFVDVPCKHLIAEIPEITDPRLWNGIKSYGVSIESDPVERLEGFKPPGSFRPSDGSIVLFAMERAVPPGTPEPVTIVSNTGKGQGIIRLQAQSVRVSPQEHTAFDWAAAQPETAAAFFPAVPKIQEAVNDALGLLRDRGETEMAATLESFAPGEVSIAIVPWPDAVCFAIDTAWHGRKAIVAIERGEVDANTLADAVAAMHSHGLMKVALHEAAIVKKPSGAPVKGAENATLADEIKRRIAEFDRQRALDPNASDALIKRRAAEAMGVDPKTIERALKERSAARS